MLEESTKDIMPMNNSREVCFQKALEFNEEVIRLDGIAGDPKLLRKKIDVICSQCSPGSRRAVAMYNLGMDSRLVDSGGNPPENVHVKNSGGPGKGKSFPLEITLKLYPESAYFQLYSMSPKALIYMGDDLSFRVLIITEADYLAKNKEAAGIVRSLISEGYYTHITTAGSNGERCLVRHTVRGPISFITTTTAPELEYQLEDRLFTIHPNDSVEATYDALKQMAASATNRKKKISEEKLNEWRNFHAWLVPKQVEIPFISEILEKYLELNTIPTDGALRNFKRIISSIMTITVLYQGQRWENNEGVLTAELPDYAMAYQLINNSVIERLQGGPTKPDVYIDTVREEGPMSLTDLARKLGIPKSTVSDNVIKRVKSGALLWTDKNGNQFSNEARARRAKQGNGGGAYIRVHEAKGLPSPFELTGDMAWLPGGEHFNMYNLGLE
ncbi:hypothetical protein [Desulfonatronum parangueonense]